MTLVRMVTGWLFLALIVCFAWVGSVLTMIPILLILPFSQPLFRGLNDWFSQQFFVLTSFMLEQIIGVKFILTGHIPSDPNESMILLSNHRTRTDWIFLWSLFVHRFNSSHMKIALKHSLKYVPGVGWACQMFSFLFLKRNWNEDKENISGLLGSWVKRKYPCQLLFFAEGTDLSKGNLRRSHAFAEKKGLPKYNYVLHPRITGFLHCYEQLKENIDAVYDVTIAYPDLLTQGEKELLTGRFPYEIHIHMERYSKNELDEEDDLGEWCNAKWQEKEERLARFYTETGSFVSPTNPPQPPLPVPVKDILLSLSFWSFWLLLTYVPFVMYSWVRWCFLVGNVVFTLMSYFNWYLLEVKAVNAQFKDKKE